jgi:hypothetical protein
LIEPPASIPKLATVIACESGDVTSPAVLIARVFEFAGEIAALTVTVPEVASPIRIAEAVVLSSSASEISTVFDAESVAEPKLITVPAVAGASRTFPEPAFIAAPTVIFCPRIDTSLFAAEVVIVALLFEAKLVEAEMSMFPFEADSAPVSETPPPCTEIGPVAAMGPKVMSVEV